MPGPPIWASDVFEAIAAMTAAAQQLNRLERILPSERHVSELCRTDLMIRNLKFLPLFALVFLSAGAVAKVAHGE
jgi:hypothetical protein